LPLILLNFSKFLAVEPKMTPRIDFIVETTPHQPFDGIDCGFQWKLTNDAQSGLEMKARLSIRYLLHLTYRRRIGFRSN